MKQLSVLGLVCRFFGIGMGWWLSWFILQVHWLGEGASLSQENGCKAKMAVLEMAGRLLRFGVRWLILRQIGSMKRIWHGIYDYIYIYRCITIYSCLGVMFLLRSTNKKQGKVTMTSNESTFSCFNRRGGCWFKDLDFGERDATWSWGV